MKNEDKIVELLSDILIEMKGNGTELKAMGNELKAMGNELKIHGIQLNDLKTEIQGLNEAQQETNRRLETLELQQTRTNRMLENVERAIEDLADKFDFDTVHIDREVEIEMEGVRRKAIIRKPANQKGLGA